MPRLCRWFCVVCLMILLPGLVGAQAATAPKYFGLTYLARDKSTQTETKMTKKQVEGVDKLIKDLNDKYKDDLAKLKELKPAERYKKEGELHKMAGEDASKGLADILSADQFKRLKQLHVQRRGPYAFGEAEVAESLKLTKEQQAKLRDMEKDYQKALVEVSKLTDADERTRKVTAALKEAMDKAMTILTDEQKKTWNDLTGVRFKG